MGRICSVDTCDRPVTSRGWCATHYKRWQRRGAVDDPAETSSACAVEACERPVDARGLCHGHDQRRRRTGSVQAHIPLGRRRQPETCTVDGCEQVPKGDGLCPRHWWRRWRHGTVDAPPGKRVILEDGGERPCLEPSCDRPAVARDRCRTCYKAALRAGVVEADPDVRVATGEGWLTHGYWGVVVPPEDRHLTNGRASTGEHRLVMARALGRPLQPDEQVHHVNGNRLDNRLENLELWSTSQPSGQRVEQKVDWALAIIRRYAPEHLSERNTATGGAGGRGGSPEEI
jgi:hypothetical protein